MHKVFSFPRKYLRGNAIYKIYLSSIVHLILHAFIDNVLHLSAARRRLGLLLRLGFFKAKTLKKSLDPVQKMKLVITHNIH